MATATVVVASVTIAPDGDTATAAGTVNGTAVTAQGWKSATTGMTANQKLSYVAGLLKAAYLAQAAPTDAGIAGTVTV